MSREFATAETSSFDLGRLLAPIEPERFFQETWEKQPLAVVRNEPGYYQGLFSLADVDAVIAFTRPKFLDPAEFSPEGPQAHSFVQSWLADDRPFPVEIYPGVSEVRQAFARGKTVIITSMQQRWPAVAAMCRNLEAVFACPVHANLYLTPPGAQGFAVHFDTHEVLVLQIEGSKHWRFYGPVRDLPLADDTTPVAKDQLGPPTLETVAQAGDLLYMPRGHAHEAFTSDRTSLHLTVGIKLFRWADLLHLALDQVSRRDVRLRAGVPPGLLTGAGAPATVQNTFRELLELVAQEGRLEDAAEGFASTFLAKMPVLPGNQFVAAEEADRLGLDSVVERAPGMIGRVTWGAGGVRLEFPGSNLDGPPQIASALHFMIRTPRFTVRALPDDLTANAKLVLVRRLVRDRFLRVCS